MVFSTSFASTSSFAAQTAPVSVQEENGPIETVRSSFVGSTTVISQRWFRGRVEPPRLRRPDRLLVITVVGS